MLKQLLLIAVFAVVIPLALMGQAISNRSTTSTPDGCGTGSACSLASVTTTGAVTAGAKVVTPFVDAGTVWAITVDAGTANIGTANVGTLNVASDVTVGGSDLVSGNITSSSKITSYDSAAFCYADQAWVAASCGDHNNAVIAANSTVSADLYLLAADAGVTRVASAGGGWKAAGGSTLGAIWRTGAVTIDYPNITAGNCAAIDVGLPNAAVSDPCLMGVPGAFEDSLNWQCYVTDAGYVTGRVCNDNLITAVNPASGTFKFEVHQ